MMDGVLRIAKRGRAVTVVAGAASALMLLVAMVVPLAHAYAAGAVGNQSPDAAWEHIAGVKIEVDGRDTGKTITLASGQTHGITHDVLPQDLPRRDKMKFTEAFVVIQDHRYAVNFLGGREGKVYYSLKGKDADSELIVTSVSSGSDVILAFEDETEPLTVTVGVGGGAAVAPEDNYTAIGLDDVRLDAQGQGSQGSFTVGPGGTRTFLVEKQIAQEISVTPEHGEAKKLSGGNDDPVQTWEYKAPENGTADSLTITAKGTTRKFKVTAKMNMPQESLGGGVNDTPQSNRMFGNTAIAGYRLDDGVDVKDWGPGNEAAFANPRSEQNYPDFTLTDNTKLSRHERQFFDASGQHHGDGGLALSPERSSVSGEMEIPFDRSKRDDKTVLIDMVTTRCTPGNQAWAPQMAGVTVNDTAIPFKGFDYSTQGGGPNTNDSLEHRFGDWVTLDGKAKGTKVRVVSLGAWGQGEFSDHLSLGVWEFHHYIVELREITGPVEIEGIYITSANARVVNVGSEGVETQISQKNEATGTYFWGDIAPGGSLQAKNMATIAGQAGTSHVRIMPKKGYTLDGATANVVKGQDGTVGMPLLAAGEWVGEKQMTSNRYELSSPPGKPWGYSYFYAEAPVVNHSIEYDANGGTYEDGPIDNKLYNVEGLFTLTVDARVPHRADAAGSWVFNGYALVEVDANGGETQLKTGIKPGDTIDLSTVPLTDAKKTTKRLRLKAMWQEPAALGATISAKVDIKLQDAAGSEEYAEQKTVLLAKGANYEFVNLPVSFEHNGATYVFSDERSDVQSGTAATEGQVIGEAVYVRYADGVLVGKDGLHGTKRVAGAGAPALQGGEFTFRLTPDTPDAPMPAADTVTNAADGTFAFGDITFDAPGTYVYRITEEQRGPANYTFDAHELVVTATVSTPDAPGKPFAVSVSEQGSRIFTNEYHKPAPQPVTLVGATHLAGMKTLEGQDAPRLAKGQFSFELAAATPGAPLPAQTTVANDASGGFAFGDITFTQPGRYVYKVREVPGTDKAITYDDTVYTLTVMVEEPEVHGGQLRLSLEGSRPFAFTNVYDASPEPAPEDGRPAPQGDAGHAGGEHVAGESRIPATGDALGLLSLAPYALTGAGLAAAGFAARRRR